MRTRAPGLAIPPRAPHTPSTCTARRPILGAAARPPPHGPRAQGEAYAERCRHGEGDPRVPKNRYIAHHGTACIGGAARKGVCFTMGGTAPHYVQWGVLSITVPNLVVLGLMLVVFAAALALRLPEHADRGAPPPRTEGEEEHRSE